MPRCLNCKQKFEVADLRHRYWKEVKQEVEQV